MESTCAALVCFSGVQQHGAPVSAGAESTGGDAARA